MKLVDEWVKDAECRESDYVNSIKSKKPRHLAAAGLFFELG